MTTGADLTYQTNATALQKASAIFGDCVTVSGASYNGPTPSQAIYSIGHRLPRVVPSATGIFLSAGNSANFSESSGDPNRSAGRSANTTGGTAEATTFSGTAEDNIGHIKAAFVTVNSVPCVVAGTHALISSGEVAAERLQAGDLVMTQDDGPQPLHWIGHPAILAVGDHSPVLAELISPCTDLNLAPGQGYSLAARKALHGFKAQVLFANAQAA